jgi:ribonuclease P protein subunit POP4
MHEYNNRNIVIHELVGLDVEVVDSKDPSQIGTRGRVIRETKNLLYVKTENNIKQLVKSISVFKFSNGGQQFTVGGNEINFRSDERTVKALRFYKRRKN